MPLVTTEPPASKPPDKETVTVEAVRRRGFPGFYCLGRLFPSGQPVEIEVTTKDIYKTKKVTDPDTDEVREEKYLFRQSELKTLLAHSAFLKVFRSTQTPIGAEPSVKAGAPDHVEANRKAIKLANEEATTAGDKGPTGSMR
jgi:hypothetical protein